MYFKEHGTPHFHAQYGKEHAVFDIEKIERMAGRFPKKGEQLVVDWAGKHQKDCSKTGN